MRRIFKIAILLFLTGIFAPKYSYSQDPQFGHFYANSLLYNPAFTGNVDLGRFSLSYRNQWPGISAKFVSYSASYDHYLNELNSGIGIQFTNDKAGSGGLTNTSVNFLYSYQIQINRKLALMAGLKAGFQNRRYEFEDFIFPDQIANNDAPTSAENDFRDQIVYANFGQGVILYHIEKYWVGFSFDHLNRPNNAFGNQESRLPISFSFQGGYNIEIDNNLGGNSGTTLTLATLYKAQQKWDQLDIGAYYKVEPFVVGLWYRGLPVKDNESPLPNYDAIMIMAGFNWDRISFAYSYDITISRLAGNTAGAHEISLILEYPKSKRRRSRFMRIPCPKF